MNLLTKNTETNESFNLLCQGDPILKTPNNIIVVTDFSNAREFFYSETDEGLKVSFDHDLPWRKVDKVEFTKITSKNLVGDIIITHMVINFTLN